MARLHLVAKSDATELGNPKTSSRWRGNTEPTTEYHVKPGATVRVSLIFRSRHVTNSSASWTDTDTSLFPSFAPRAIHHFGMLGQDT
jgi:hypothetical protein